MRLLVVSLSLAAALAQVAQADQMPILQRGDVIFQNSLSPQSLAISLATQSEYTHVGIVDFDEAGEVVVLEAVGPTLATPFEEWVTHGADGDIAIYRFDGLTEDQALAVTTAAREHFGKRYDPFFYASEDELYCSELVFIAFRDGMGVELGQMQKLSELNLGSTAAQALIGERWDRHPLCKDGQAGDAEACLALIQDGPLITPQAQAEDERLTLIYSTFGR
ncbi:YiiX/YebB-like N1pC/P60 family cysteine hydrolase [Tabrizicola sp.]|uniref:YiiX/YebB-like N1pC/P60 family cysteine hydrolase n=1 Tax=Tabrizicola sp. TaxID=2005166 RepID=UPI003F3B86F4